MNYKTAIRSNIFHITAIFILFWIWISIYLLGLNQTAIIDPSEGYYAEAAREMVESGDWIIPHLNYQIYFSKPILTFWLMATAYKLFGVSEFSTRIMFSLLALLLLTGVFLLSRRIGGVRCGIFSTIICATAPLMMAVSRLSPIDISFTCFLNLALFSWIKSYIFSRPVYWAFFYLFLGLAVLTKGPTAILIILFGLAAYFLTEFLAKKQYRNDLLLKTILTRFSLKHLLWGILIFMAVVLPWYLAVGFATHGLFLKVFFLYENVARFAGHTNLGKGHLYNYLPVLAYGFAPWIIFLPTAIKYIVDKYIKGQDTAQSSVIKSLICLLCFAGSFFTIISLSKTQLDTYLLPIIAPLAILIGYYLEQALQAQSSPANKSFPAIKLISILFAITGITGLIVLIVLVSLKIPGSFKLVLSLILPALAIGYITQCWLCMRGRVAAMLFVLCGTTALVAASSFHLAFHILNRSNQDNLKKLSLRYKDSKDELCLFHAFKPSVMFYTEKPIESFFHPGQLIVDSSTAETKLSRLLILAHTRSLPTLTAIPNLILQPIDKQGAWYMLLASNATLQKGIVLEKIFSNPETFKSAMKGTLGPLTVPCSAGIKPAQF